MITKANILACAASIQMGPGGSVNFEVGCAISRSGTGTYNLLVDGAQTVPPSVGSCYATYDAAVYVGPVVPAHVSDTAGNGSQTLFSLTIPGGDFPGNLGVYVVAVGGGNPSNPSQTGI